MTKRRMRYIISGMIDIATLQAALVGYQSRLDEITAKMTEIRRTLGIAKSGGGAISTPSAKPERKKRTLSAAARKRIAAAQRQRWAAFHKQQAGAAKPKAKT